MRVALVLSIAAGFTFGLVSGATYLVGSDPPQVQRPTAVVWADRVFTSRDDLAAWLEARGSNYSVWAVRHPDLARTFEIRFGDPAAPPSDARSDPTAGENIQSRTNLLLLLVGGVPLSIAVSLTALQAVRRFVRRRWLDHAASARGLGPAPMARARTRAKAEPHRSPKPSNPPAVIGLRRLRSAFSTLSVPLSAPRLFTARRVPRHASPVRVQKPGRGAGGFPRISVRALLHDQLRQPLSDIAWYGTSALLAFAVGAWIAIYLK